MSSVAKRLGVNYHTLRAWVQHAKAACATSTVPADLPPEGRLREIDKENARLRMERDILEKPRPIPRHWMRRRDVRDARINQRQPPAPRKRRRRSI
jgi:transposase-like protein